VVTASAIFQQRSVHAEMTWIALYSDEAHYGHCLFREWLCGYSHQLTFEILLQKSTSVDNCIVQRSHNAGDGIYFDVSELSLAANYSL